MNYDTAPSFECQPNINQTINFTLHHRKVRQPIFTKLLFSLGPMHSARDLRRIRTDASEDTPIVFVENYGRVAGSNCLNQPDSTAHATITSSA